MQRGFLESGEDIVRADAQFLQNPPFPAQEGADPKNLLMKQENDIYRAFSCVKGWTAKLF